MNNKPTILGQLYICGENDPYLYHHYRGKVLPSVCLALHQSMCPSFYFSVRPLLFFSFLFSFPTFRTLVLFSVRPSAHPSVHPLGFPYVRLLVRSSAYPSLFLLLPLSDRLSTCPSKNATWVARTPSGFQSTMSNVHRPLHIGLIFQSFL